MACSHCVGGGALSGAIIPPIHSQHQTTLCSSSVGAGTDLKLKALTDLL